MTGVEQTFLSLLICLVAAISFSDFRNFRIPNVLNAALFAIGLVFVISNDELDALLQVTFAGVLFSMFYGVRQLHSKLRNQIGLGMGDVKMAGASAVWIYPLNLPYFVMIASFIALVFALAASSRYSKKTNPSMIVPFGPFIGTSLVLVWTGQTLKLFSLGII